MNCQTSVSYTSASGERSVHVKQSNDLLLFGTHLPFCEKTVCFGIGTHFANNWDRSLRPSFTSIFPILLVRKRVAFQCPSIYAME